MKVGWRKSRRSANAEYTRWQWSSAWIGHIQEVSQSHSNTLSNTRVQCTFKLLSTPFHAEHAWYICECVGGKWRALNVVAIVLGNKVSGQHVLSPTLCSPQRTLCVASVSSQRFYSALIARAASLLASAACTRVRARAVSLEVRLTRLLCASALACRVSATLFSPPLSRSGRDVTNTSKRFAQVVCCNTACTLVYAKERNSHMYYYSTTTCVINIA